MSILRAVAGSCLALLLIAGCGPLPSTITLNLEPGTQDVSSIVEATLQAMTAEPAGEAAATPSAAPAGDQTGSIAGSLNYPAESLPAMYVVAFRTNSQSYKYIVTSEGQSSYQIDGLPPGTYHIVAYTVGSQSFPAGLAGGYTQAVPCGLTASCNDHTLINVAVGSGQAVTGINPADWYLVEGAFPAIPEQAGQAPAPTAIAPGAGSISGTLMYPASSIPALRIIAFQVGSSTYYYVDTAPGQSTYVIDDLPPGNYHVVAYVRPGGGFNSGPAGGYSQMVPCGLQYGCTDHTLINVQVVAGATTIGVDPNDYYADPGAFPPNPAP